MMAATLAFALAAASTIGPPILLHTTFDSPPMPHYITGYYALAFERHITGPQPPYGMNGMSQPVAVPYFLTFEGDSWEVWVDYPLPGQVIYMCVGSYNAHSESECVTQEVY